MCNHRNDSGAIGCEKEIVLADEELSRVNMKRDKFPRVRYYVKERDPGFEEKMTTALHVYTGRWR
ncbi:MAG: hypothetical protein M1496_06805 [Candidatus Thermoplasmatota archaeon]|jgi:hypothetical protein|nr:hypothetical protein [Candidatus Thermoplasmatota archaeon]